MNGEAAGLPVTKDGFRLRGQEITRTETFTDAAFAFAVTLLVISVEAVPSSYAELLAALRGVPAFALSFAVLLLFWYGHWQWSRRFGLEDLPTIVLSAMLVFTALVYVYPLKYVFSLMMVWVSGGRFSSTATLQGPDQLYGIFAVYGIGFTAMALIIGGLNADALRRGDALELNAIERFITRSELRVWLILAGAGMLSTFGALFTSPSPFAWPGWVYMLISIVMLVFGARSERAFKRLREEEERSQLMPLTSGSSRTATVP